VGLFFGKKVVLKVKTSVPDGTEDNLGGEAQTGTMQYHFSHSLCLLN
jgi:hypothetical protein